MAAGRLPLPPPSTCLPAQCWAWLVVVGVSCVEWLVFWEATAC